MNENYPVEERNQMLVDFFKTHDIEVKLIGDKNKPKVIINGDNVLSGFVHNKKFIFTSKQFGGEAIYTINLHRTDFYTTQLINKLIETNNKTKVYRIVHNDNEKYYLKTIDDTPIFSNEDSRYYFSLEKANKTLVYLTNLHQLDVSII